jgi:hypothetical protein
MRFQVEEYPVGREDEEEEEWADTIPNRLMIVDLTALLL